jgi:hypothetical protein
MNYMMKLYRSSMKSWSSSVYVEFHRYGRDQYIS